MTSNDRALEAEYLVEKLKGKLMLAVTDVQRGTTTFTPHDNPMNHNMVRDDRIQTVREESLEEWKSRRQQLEKDIEK